MLSDGIVSFGTVVVPALLETAPARNVNASPKMVCSKVSGATTCADGGATARQHGARAIVIEDLDFAEAREQGREHHGNRPGRGRRGRAFRHQIAGIPTARFRDRLTHMALLGHRGARA